MAEKAGKDGADPGVMGNLSSTRPSRLSRRARAEGAATEPDTAAPAAPRASKRPAASQRRTPAPRPRAVRAGAPALGEPARKAVAGREAAADDVPARDQGGAELAVTVVKAAGELAQIGATVAGQIIKRAAGRLPRP